MDVVTGAFGYTGRFITQRLLQSACVVRTLTDHPGRPNPFGERVDLAPLAFDDRRTLVASLHGVEVLYNTYWIRFARGDVTFDRAVRNTRYLVEAAVEAGARGIVHLSIANPASSTLPYFTGKARAEQLVVESSLRYGIVRPTVLFGGGDVLINNIAWLLRGLPVFAIAGSGAYRIRPVHVDDVAAIATAAGRRNDSVVLDAIGPETYTFEETRGSDRGDGRTSACDGARPVVGGARSGDGAGPACTGRARDRRRACGPCGGVSSPPTVRPPARFASADGSPTTLATSGVSMRPSWPANTADQSHGPSRSN
jgi:uncharacterized protein YbjT (DUF2867 family)